MPSADRINSTCPVTALARDLRAGLKLRDALDRQALEGHQGFDRFDAIEDHLIWLERTIARTEARSPLGALVQVILASNEVDHLYSFAQEHNPNALETARRLAGLLYGVAAFLHDEFGITEGEIASHYMPDRLNPHALLREALAGVV